MGAIQRRTHFPDSLMGAIGAYAQAIMRGDENAGSKFVTAEPQALASNRATFERSARQGPWHGFELIARARLGFQFIVKIRLHGPCGDLTLQCRWREEEGIWRIAEIADVGLRSPWLKPDSSAATAGNANG